MIISLAYTQPGHGEHEHVPSFAPLEFDTPLYRTAIAQFDRPCPRQGRPRRRRAPAPSGAVDHRRCPMQARRRHARRLPGLPRPAFERARPDEGRHPLRPRGQPRRVRGARRLDDVEVRAAAAAPTAARREACAATRVRCPGRDRARDAPLHVGTAAVHRPAGGHPRAGHGDERADDGLDDGHLLHAARPRRARDRDREADLDRRLGFPARGDRGRRGDGRSRGLASGSGGASPSCVASCRASATSAGSRRRSWSTAVRPSSACPTCRAASTIPTGSTSPR